jgi:excisionase family DNA binding protein
MDKFYTTFEAAKMCHVSPSSLIRWIREGKLPAANTAGGHHRVSASDLVQLLKSLRMPIPLELQTTETEQLRVLIVDDEIGMRQMIRWVLEQNFKDVVVEEAQEGFIAGWKAHSLKPHLVILDLMLPGMDGFHVCQFIRSFTELKDTKIISISALQDPEVRSRILTMGADEFLVKPFDVELLREKISNIFKVSGFDQKLG